HRLDPRVQPLDVERILLPHVEIDEALHLRRRRQRDEVGGVGQPDLLDGVIQLLHRQRRHQLLGVGLAQDGVGLAPTPGARQGGAPAAEGDDAFVGFAHRRGWSGAPEPKECGAPRQACYLDRSSMQSAFLIGAYYFTFFAALGIFLPFFALWLVARGLPPSEATRVLSLTPLMTLLVPPLWGLVADARRARVWLLRGGSLFTFLAFLGFFRASTRSELY